MNKKIKKAAAIMAAAVLCLSMSMTVFASDRFDYASPDAGDIPAADDQETETEVEKEITQIWSGSGLDKDGNKVTVLSEKVSAEVEEILKDTDAVKDILKDAGYDVNRLSDGKKLVLITGHRRENFGDGFINMCTAIKDLSHKYPDVDFVYPMHLNPNVRKPIHEVFGEDLGNLGNMFFIEPLEYLSFVYLMEKSTIVLTDSGGIQEEAPGLGKPVLVMRDTTERPEALDAGTVKLVGTDYDKIVNSVSELLDDRKAYERMSKAVNPYGDGKACARIVNSLF